MKKNYLLFLFLIIFFPSYSQESKSASAIIEETLAEYADTFAKYNFGAQVSYLRNGKLVTKTAGMSHDSFPVVENTVFNIGSISKIFTSVLIGIATDEGLLELEDTAASYLPKYKRVLNGATLGELLTHKSGIAEVAVDSIVNDAFLSIDSRYNNTNIMEFIGEPRTDKGKFRYCNSNYIICANILEKIYDLDFIDLLRQKIFYPLQMNNTFPYVSKSIENLAHPHHESTDLYTFLHFKYSADVSKGAGSITTDSKDLLTFASSLATGRLVSKAYWSMMKPNCLLDIYGLGLQCYPKINGQKYYGHGGFNIGYKSMLVFDEVNNEYFVFLFNLSDNKLCLSIIDKIMINLKQL